MSLQAAHGYSDATSIGSGGEIESSLTQWLGPPNQSAPLNLDVEGKNPHTTHNLPLAYWGKSVAMEKVIEFLVTGKDEWYTKELMPWKRSDVININWMVFKYDKSFFEVEPFGGNPNYIQSGIEAHSDKMIQRGK
jgi:arylamine N-acetyltransferase